jgi:hypothetical protein
MSPWGRFYLETVPYHPSRWEPFESWRMWGTLDHILTKYGYRFRVFDHLDKLSVELRHSEKNV